MKNIKKFQISLRALFIILFLCNSGYIYSQVTITDNQTAQALAQKIAGSGITVTNATLTCNTLANGFFNATSSNLGLDSGIILTTGRAKTTGTTNSLTGANGPATQTPSKSWGGAGDAQLGALVNATTYDACSLEFDLIPQGDTLQFDYVFGSEEYKSSVCYIYNDVFAFFISGPSINGTQNIALVPGTTIPVTVNSINNGVPGSNANGSSALCTAMGPGAPFTQYYVDNTNGTTITYRGFTTVLKAEHAVQPCNTYHLKIAIADVADGTYDSGVFLKAGSLHSNTYKFDSVVGSLIAGTPHSTVKGCAPAIVTVHASQALSTAQTIKYIIAGTGINGTDYSQLADSVIILPNDTTALITIQGIPTAINGTKTVKLYLLSPYSCGIVDSILVNLLDAPFADIAIPDTTVCSGSSVSLITNASSGLVYNWSPAAGLSNANSQNPVVTPTQTTTYQLMATWPGTGCAPVTDSIIISIVSVNATILTPDTIICRGDSIHILVNGNNSYIYNWSPATGLSDSVIKEPVAMPQVSTTYELTVSDSNHICPSIAKQLTINIGNVDVNIITPDTTICDGTFVTLQVNGNDNYIYSWSPAGSLNNAHIKNPTATPVATTAYQLTASLNGNCAVTKNVTLTVFDIAVDAGQDQSVCAGTNVQLNAKTFPDTFSYTYSWNGPDNFNATTASPVIDNTTTVAGGTYTVTALIDNCKAESQVNIEVKPIPEAPAVTSPISLCEGKLAEALTASGDNLLWYDPYNYDSSATYLAPIPNTATDGLYTYFVTQTINDCISPKSAISIQVAPCCEGNYFMPSAFTPNNDGKNDNFKIDRTPNFIITQFNIYNRWGQLVFEGNNSNDSWNGNYNGQPADMGTYYYLVTISCINTNRTDTKKGEITLIR